MLEIAVVVVVGRADQRAAEPRQREDRPAAPGRTIAPARSGRSASAKVMCVPRLGRIWGTSASSCSSSRAQLVGPHAGRVDDVGGADPSSPRCRARGRARRAPGLRSSSSPRPRPVRAHRAEALGLAEHGQDEPRRRRSGSRRRGSRRSARGRASAGSSSTTSSPGSRGGDPGSRPSGRARGARAAARPPSRRRGSGRRRPGGRDGPPRRPARRSAAAGRGAGPARPAAGARAAPRARARGRTSAGSAARRGRACSSGSTSPTRSRALEQGDAVAAARRVERDAGPGDAAADHDHVEGSAASARSA